MARTSAFVPRRQGLITDSNFSQIYEAPGGTTITGGLQLGTGGTTGSLSATSH